MEKYKVQTENFKWNFFRIIILCSNSRWGGGGYANVILGSWISILYNIWNLRRILKMLSSFSDNNTKLHRFICYLHFKLYQGYFQTHFISIQVRLLMLDNFLFDSQSILKICILWIGKCATSIVFRLVKQYLGTKRDRS